MDPSTGVVTFVPAAGFVGQVELHYVVTDADGVQSDEAVVAVLVAEDLPVTGSSPLALLGIAGALVAAGLVLVLRGRARTARR